MYTYNTLTMTCKGQPVTAYYCNTLTEFWVCMQGSKFMAMTYTLPEENQAIEAVINEGLFIQSLALPVTDMQTFQVLMESFNR
jgi:hypothetical protein